MKAIFIFLLLSLCSCASQETPKPTTPLVKCQHMYDPSLAFIYYPENLTKYYDDFFEVEVFVIKDINNETLQLNQFEFENYTCMQEGTNNENQ